MANFISVPFKTESEHGLASASGVAKFSSAGVIIEFEKKLFGLISDGFKEVRLAIDDILDVRIKKGIFKRSAKIEIRPRSMMAFNGLPHTDGKLVLKIQGIDLSRAHEAVENLDRDLAQYNASLPLADPPPISFLPNESEDDTKELR